jgi:MULE transposase domain
MHPEFIVCDTTFGTNNTVKEMFTVAIKDGNNKAFFAARAYIPNSQKWVFDILFRWGLRQLWSKTVTDRVNLIVTDGCTQLRSAALSQTTIRTTESSPHQHLNAKIVIHRPSKHPAWLSH